MMRSSFLSLAALSAALLLSLPASAHDPKEFDKMLDAAPASADATACTKLDASSHSKPPIAAAEVKSLRVRCAAEKKAKAQPASSKTSDKK